MSETEHLNTRRCLFTNADLYRSYSDEQLAELFNQIETEGKAYGPRGKKAWLDWLKQGVTTNSTT